MLTPQQLLDIGMATNRDALRAQLTRAAHDLGFGLFSAVLIRGELGATNAELFGVGNPPAAYLEAQYNLPDTLHDPVMSALRSSILPMTYDQGTYTDAGVADLWDLQASFGYRCGVAASVHQPSHLEQFMFGVDRPDQLPTDPIARMRLSSAVQMLTVHAQAAMARMVTPTSPETEALTDGDLETLRWARDGCTVWQIGDKLAISASQVSRIERSAVKKLGVSTTAAAVLRCIQGGLIG